MKWLALLLFACGGTPDASCDPPVVYEKATCDSAPDVGFCVAEEHVADAEALLPTLRCGTALPPCEAGAVSCRFAPPVDDANDPCNEARVSAYNAGICELWTPRLAISVTVIPLD